MEMSNNNSALLSPSSPLQTILQISQEVQAHKSASLTLAHRCQVLFSGFERERIEKMMTLLRNIEEFLRRFIKPSGDDGSNSIQTRMSWFSGLVNDHFSNLQTFQQFTTQINELALELRMTVEANPKEIHTQDSEDIREDLQSLRQELSLFRKQTQMVSTSEHDKDRVKELQTQCAILIKEWDEKNTEIVALEKQISQVMINLQQRGRSANNSQENRRANSKTKNKTTKTNEEISQELTQIQRRIEDLALDPVQFPQLEVMIKDLNNSFVTNLDQLNDSLKDEFKTQFKELKDTHKILLSASLKNDDNQNKILNSLQRIEVSDHEDFIRKDRLSQLETFPSQYTVDQSSSLGKGAFGEVKVGRYDNRTVAIKIISTESSSFSDKEKKTIENEVLLMSLCNHPSVLNIFGYCKVDPHTVHLLLELCPQGSLWSYLKNKDPKVSIPMSQNIAWMLDLASALHYLHLHRIIHRDVKAENLLLYEGLHCRLSDFGLTKRQMERSFCCSSHTYAGSLAFMAPELKNEGKSSHRSDVYAFGVTCFQILSRSVPSPEQTVTKISLYMSSENLESLENMMMSCLETEPKNRISARKACELLESIQSTLQYLDPDISTVVEEIIPESFSESKINSNETSSEPALEPAPEPIPDLIPEPALFLKFYSNKWIYLFLLPLLFSFLIPHIFAESPEEICSSLYTMSRNGNGEAFHQLESLSGDTSSINENERIVCLGYLMILLFNYPIPNIIPLDKERAISISRIIVPKISDDLSDYVTVDESNYDSKYGSLFPHEQFILGRVYYEGIGVDKNETEAVRLFTLASNQGNADAQYSLGYCYANGIGVDKNGTEAVRLYTLASNQGYALAQNNLGVCYVNGTGVDKNETEAVRLYTLASNQGNDAAQNNLGYCYYQGIGVDKNGTEAVRLFTLSSNQGHVDAQNNLGVCYEQGIGVDKNETEAVRLFTLASDQGLANAQFNLGYCYQEGIGVDKNETEAVRLYTLASDQGHADAQNNLGYCYANGIGVDKNESEVVRLFTLSSNQGNVDAQYLLGVCYEQGIGVDKNEREAVKLFTLASDQGYAAATEKLKYLSK